MEILIIDIETTGWLKSGGKIVEVGIVALDLNTGARDILFDEVVHERPILKTEVEKSWIIKNSTLTVADIQNSKRLQLHQPTIQSILNRPNAGCTAFNNVFDFDYMEDRGFVFPRKLACPMKLLTPIMKLSKKKGSGYKWPSVEEAYKYFFPNSNYVELHRGADDAVHEAAIVHEMYKRNIFRV